MDDDEIDIEGDDDMGIGNDRFVLQFIQHIPLTYDLYQN